MACSLRRETRVGFIRTQNVCYYLCAIDNYCGISSQAVACMPKLTQILTDTSHIVYGGTLDSRREDSIQMHLFSTTFGCIVCRLSPRSTISACFQWQGVAHYHLPSNAHSITVDCFHQRHVIIPQRPSTRPKLDKNKLADEYWTRDDWNSPTSFGYMHGVHPTAARTHQWWKGERWWKGDSAHASVFDNSCMAIHSFMQSNSYIHTSNTSFNYYYSWFRWQYICPTCTYKGCLTCNALAHHAFSCSGDVLIMSGPSRL